MSDARLSSASAVQHFGRRPPGLPDAIRMTPEWECLRRSIYKHAVRLTDHLHFDFRELLTDAAHARLAGELMWRLIRPHAPQVLIGPGFGAAPLLYGIARAALDDGVNLQVLMVRDKRKEHNQKRWVEGNRAAARGKRAVLVDDFMMAGSAPSLVDEAVTAEGLDLDIVAIAVFFDMWEPLGSRQLSASARPVLALFTRHDIGLSRDAFDALPPAMTGTHPPLLTEPLWWRQELNVKLDYPFKSAPVIADDAVFVADDQARVWRHNAATGDIEWRYDSLSNPAKGIVQRLQYAGGSLVFGCYDGTITRLDARTGRVVWRRRQDTHVHATPEIDLPARRVYVNTEQWNQGKPFGRLIALDFDTGRLLWSQQHAHWAPASPALNPDRRTVVAACNDLGLIGVATADGAVLWRQVTDGLVRGRPAIDGDAVVVATETGHLQCFHAATGERRWNVQYGQGSAHQHTLVHEGRVYTLDGKWHCAAFDLATGELCWITRLRSPGNGAPVRLGRFLVVASSEGHLAVLDPIREVKVWEGSMPGTYRQPPAIGVSGGRTLLAAASTDQGLRVYEIDPHYLAGVDFAPHAERQHEDAYA